MCSVTTLEAEGVRDRTPCSILFDKMLQFNQILHSFPCLCASAMLSL